MDVLRPQLVRIGNRVYRKNLVASREGTNPEDEIDEPDYDMAEACYNDEICDANLNIEEFSGGFRIRLDVASAYFKFIIGKRGDTRRRLETETKTRIIIPRAGQEGEIVIQGHDKKGVVSAKTRIEVIVDSARQKQPFTHFLSIPILSEEVTEKFEDFRFTVMDDDARDTAVDASIFQSPQKLHLTIGTMVLFSDKEIQKVKNLLQTCYEDLVQPILQGNPLFFDIKGLEYMNDDPGAVDVLHAKIQPGPEADKLQMLADRLVDRFVSANLMQRQYERVKLHITVMNTLFRRDSSGISSPRHQQKGFRKDRESFNATSILKKFGDFDFGSYQADAVDLSQRYTTAHNGYYSSCGSLQLL